LNNLNLAKARIAIANGDLDLSRAYDALKEGNIGKVRTSARRAAGYYLEALLILEPNKDYGAHFMAHLRGLQYDVNMPEDLRNCADNLTKRLSEYEMTGEDAVSCANKIIAYCKERLDKYFKDN
jgi:HEPN domain-containing protein